MLDRIVPTRRLKLLFEPIDIWGIDRPVPQDDIGNEHKRMFEPPDNGITNTISRHLIRGGRDSELLRGRARNRATSGSRDAAGATRIKSYCHGGLRRTR